MGGTDDDVPAAVTTDAAGYLYITGQTKSSDFPNAQRLSSSNDLSPGYVFVAKLDPSGASVVYNTIIGVGQPSAIAVDSAGNAYVAGESISKDFPTTPSAFSTSGRCFLAKLDASGSHLIYSTRLGGCESSVSIPQAGLVVDAAGSAFLTGSAGTISTTIGSYRSSGFGSFVLKMNPQGSALIYSTYLPGTAQQTYASAEAIAIDAQGNAFLTGSATPSFPGAVQLFPSASGQNDVFALKLSADGARIVYALIFGGPGADDGKAIAVDTDGSAYVSGTAHVNTPSVGDIPFPTTDGALDSAARFPAGFLAKVSPSGDALIFSTLLPGLDEGRCLQVTQAGVDVLGVQRFTGFFPDLFGSRLLRITRGGDSLINSSVSSLTVGTLCGQAYGRFGLTASSGNTKITSPDRSPIGPRGKSDVWFSAVDADVPGAPQLDVNAGAVILRAWGAANGTYPPVTQDIQAQVNDRRSVPISVIPFMNSSPAMFSTPADIPLTANQGGYTDRVTIFAPGTQDGLVVLPLTMQINPVVFNTPPIPLAVDGPNSPPATAKLHISSVVMTDVFGTTKEAPCNFTIGPTPIVSSPWLSADVSAGTTPADVTLTANPAGLPLGARFGSLQIAGPPPPRGVPGSFAVCPASTLTVQLQVGPPVAPSVSVLRSTPSEVYLHLVASDPNGSATVHVDSTGGPVSFSVDPLPDWLTVTPSSGITPLDLTVKVSRATSPDVFFNQQVLLRSKDGVTGSFLVTGETVPADYVGFVNVSPMSNQPSSAAGFAPGSLFYMNIQRPSIVPTGSADTDSGSLTFSLVGYSFKVNGIPVPLRSYTNGTFLAQMPVDLKPGVLALQAFNASGLVGTGQVTISAIVPRYLEGFANGLRARKANGSIVDASNPVRPGEPILVRLTGQGAVKPPLASGSAASIETASVPVGLLTAYFGTKVAKIESGKMSAFEAGVLDVWVTVPNLYAGDHFLSINIGPVSAGNLPIKVASSRGRIPALGGFKTLP